MNVQIEIGFGGFMEIRGEKTCKDVIKKEVIRPYIIRFGVTLITTWIGDMMGQPRKVQEKVKPQDAYTVAEIMSLVSEAENLCFA